MDVNTEKLDVQEYIQQGLTLMGAEKYEDAISYFKKAQNCDPMIIEIYYHMGTAYANLEKYEEAEQTFQKAILVDKENPLTYFHIGNIKFLSGNVVEGIENYNKAIAKGYDDEEIYYNLGMIYEESDNALLAIRNYSKAILKNPLRPDIRLHKASLYIATRQYEEALQTLEELIEVCPDLFDAYHLSVGVYCLLNRLDEAQKILDKAAQLFPEDIGILYDKIQILTARGKLDESLELIEKAQDMEDHEQEIRNLTFEKAKIYALKEDIQQAIHYFEQLKSFETEEVKDYEGRYYLMNAYLSMENYEEVLSNAEVLIGDPEQSSYCIAAFYYKAFSLAKLGKTQQAEQSYREAIKILRSITIASPGSLDAYMFRVMCHKDLKEYEKALELVDYVILLKNDNVEAHGLKGVLLDALGRKEEAEKEIKIAKQYKPDLNIVLS